MAILLRCRAGFHLPTGQVADQNRKLPSPLCRQARPCHPARLHSVVHFDARIPSGSEPATLSGPPEVYRSTRNALQRFQEQKVERLWRSVKYEEVYLKAYNTVAEARNSLASYFGFYNSRRPHSSLDRQTPDQAYFTPLPQIAAA
jgi:transposase InsO family protein